MYDSTRARAPTRLKIGPDPNPYPLLRTPTPYSEPLACVRTCACVEKDRDTSLTPNPLTPTPYPEPPCVKCSRFCTKA